MPHWVYWRTAPIDLKKLSNLVGKKVVPKTVYNKLNMKVNNLENKTPDATTLIRRNQYNTDKQILVKKIWGVDKKYLMLVV